MCQYLSLWLNIIIAGDKFLCKSCLFGRLITIFRSLSLIHRSEQVKFIWGFTNTKQFEQYGNSLSASTPLVHTDNFACLFTIVDKPLGSCMDVSEEPPHQRWTSLDIVRASTPFSAAFRQYKYILVNAGLINCSLSTYNKIIVFTTSIILSIIHNCERKHN